MTEKNHPTPLHASSPEDKSTGQDRAVQEEEARNKYLFEVMPVPKALAQMAVPTVISQLIVLIYNMADTFYIGRTNNPYMVAGAGGRGPDPAHLQCLHRGRQHRGDRRRDPDRPPDGGTAPGEGASGRLLQHLVLCLHGTLFRRHDLYFHAAAPAGSGSKR